MSVIPALGKQEDHELKASMGYIKRSHVSKTKRRARYW
jgi:hypothetical protein